VHNGQRYQTGEGDSRVELANYGLEHGQRARHRVDWSDIAVAVLVRVMKLK